MELPNSPITFAFIGYSHFFPNHIEYSFKLEIKPSYTIIVSPYSSDGGKLYRYRVKTEQGDEIESIILIAPSTPRQFDEGLRELRIRSSSDQEWMVLSDDHLQQMTDIYHRTRSD